MEVLGAQVGNGVPKTVVAAVTAAFLELGRAGRQVEFIVGDKNLFGGNLEKVRQGFDCGAAAVHKGAGVQQVQVEALPLNAGIQPVVLLFGAQRLARIARSEEHTSELQSRPHLVCRLLLEKKKV